MTRFALIPLAFFANACASAEEVQDLAGETAEEVRQGIDDIDYSKSAAAEHLLETAYAEFEKELKTQDCEMVGALTGKVTDPSDIRMTVVDASTAEMMAELIGSLTLQTNFNGGFYGQDTSLSPFNSVRIAGEWDHEAIEADVYVTRGRVIHEATLIATMTERGEASSILGVVAVCD